MSQHAITAESTESYILRMRSHTLNLKKKIKRKIPKLWLAVCNVTLNTVT